jgi:DNA end-binding protein Ku
VRPWRGGGVSCDRLREALAKENKVGISKVVLRTREHLAALKPVKDALVLELMHFNDELADPKGLSLPDARSGKKEMDMAQSLIDAMTEKWDPSKYRDEYAAALMKVIEDKVAAGGKELPPAKHTPVRSTKVVDIVSMLQQSLQQTRKTQKKGRKAA